MSQYEPGSPGAIKIIWAARSPRDLQFPHVCAAPLVRMVCMTQREHFGYCFKSIQLSLTIGSRNRGAITPSPLCQRLSNVEPAHQSSHKSSDLPAVLCGGSSLKPPGASNGGLRATSPGVASLVWSNLETWVVRGPEDVLFTRSGTSATWSPPATRPLH